MNDQDHEREDAAKSEAENQESGPFTRQFTGDAKAVPAPLPTAPENTNTSGTAWAPAPGPSDAPGDFTRMFGAANPADAAVDSNAGSLPPSPRSAGDFTKLFGAGNVQIPQVRKPGFQLDEGPGPSITASSAAAAFASRNDFPELKGPARSSGMPQPEDNLDPFRHPLAGPESVDLKLPGMPPREISGNDVPPSGYTRLFSAPMPAAKPRPAPSNTIDFRGPQPRTGPSDYTRVVSGKDAEGTPSPAAPSPAAASASPAAPMAHFPQASPPGFPQMPSPPLPSIPSAQMPPVPPGYAPQFQMQYVPAVPPPMPLAPQAPPSPVAKIPTPSAETPGSKWIPYIPVLIAFNVLFVIAVLLILLFALKK